MKWPIAIGTSPLDLGSLYMGIGGLFSDERPTLSPPVEPVKFEHMAALERRMYRAAEKFCRRSKG